MTLVQRQMLVGLISGLLFAIGLGIAGMTNPDKVLSFLDIFGEWDPSLAFVMGGAILVYMPTYRVLKGRSAPKFDTQFHWPTRNDVDAKLLIGAALFGVGWGLAGLCPGPALVAVTTGASSLVVFAAAMVGGMLLERQLIKRT